MADIEVFMDLHEPSVLIVDECEPVEEGFHSPSTKVITAEDVEVLITDNE